MSIRPFLAQSHPIGSLPLRYRPVILALLATWSVLLLILGMAPLGEIPLNDKLLHFIGMGVFTALTYFIIDVPDASRRIWTYRRAPLILTLLLAFLGADVISEVVQGMLPWKTFQFGDIIANILGSSTAYLLSHYLLTRHRHSKSLARLYLPISQSSVGGSYRPSPRNERYQTDDQERFPEGGGEAQDGRAGERRQRSESVDSVGTWDTPLRFQDHHIPPSAVGVPAEVPSSDAVQVFELGDEDELESETR